MARPKTPLTLLSPQSIRKHRGRVEARLAAPKPRGTLGYASKWLSPKEHRIWAQLVKNSPAILGESDRCLLEIACTLKARLELGTIDNPQRMQLIAVLGKLGMTPADRRPAEVQKEPDEWADFKDGE